MVPVPPPPPLLDENELAARHAARGRSWQTRVALAAAAVVLVAGGGTAAALAFGTVPGPTVTAARQAPVTVAPTPPVGAPSVSVQAAPPLGAPDAPGSGTSDGVGTPLSLPLCATPVFTHDLAAHDDAAAIAAAGGAEEFRTAIITGQAPCVRLNDPDSVWVVVDKQRPLQPKTYAPTPLIVPSGVRSVLGTPLRADAASALSRLVGAANDAGVGEIALQSGYRSYTTQEGTYLSEVRALGQAKAEAVSARAGYSEHQTGLAADVVACTGGRCGTLDDLASSRQGAWLAAHSWQYGWIVRYEPDETAVTGYDPEPWHLRYIGTALAAAYHDGGYHSLEQFFDLPPAPDYAD